jgi:hypothetical protein
VAAALGYTGGLMSMQSVASRLAAGSRQRIRFHCLLRAASCLLLVALCATAWGAQTLPFIENDYAKAVARAKAKNLPIFVEAWAPW